MAIEVELPDGSIAEFPDGTSRDIMKAAVEKRMKATPASVAEGASPTRERYKAAIRQGGDEKGNYPGTERPVPGFFGLLQRHMGDVLGVSDEVTGAGEYIGSVGGDILRGRAPDWSKASAAYDDASDRVLAEQDVARERLGWGGALAADLVGGFGTTGIGKMAAPVGNWLARSTQAAKAGAGFGAAAGVGHAEGDLVDRAAGGAEGAVTGAIAGPLLSEVVVPAGRATVNALAHPVTTAQQAADKIAYGWRTVVPGTRENIAERIFMKLRQQGMTPQDAMKQVHAELEAAKFGGTQLDPLTTLADSGPSMQALGYSVKSTSGPAKAQVENFLDARAKGSNKVPGYNGPEMSGQHERVDEYTRRALQVTRDKNAAKVEDKIVAGQKEAAGDAYDAFRDYEGVIPVDDILQGHAADVSSKLTSGNPLFAEIEKSYKPFTDEVFAGASEAMPSMTEQAQHNLRMMALDKKIAAAEQAQAKEGLVGSSGGAPAPAAGRQSAPPKAQDLVEFLRSKGGLRPHSEYGENVTRTKGLVRSKESGEGLTAEKAREELIRAGYMREPDPDAPPEIALKDFYDLLGDAASSKRIYSERGAEAAQARSDYDLFRNQTDAADRMARDHLRGIGLDPKIYDKMSRAERLEFVRRLSLSAEQRAAEENARLHFENGEFDTLSSPEKVELSRRIDAGEDPHNVFEELAIRSEGMRLADAGEPSGIKPGDSELVTQLKALKLGLEAKHKAKTRDVNLTAPSYDLSPTKFQNAYEQLGDEMSKAYKAGDGYKYGILKNLRDRLTQRADDVTGGLFTKAKESFSTPQRELDALEAGRNFKSEDVDRLPSEYKARSTPEKKAYRVGVASKIRGDLGEKGRGANVALYFDKPNMEKRMEALAGPKNAEKHRDLMAIENRMAETRNKVNKGSRTEENQKSNEDFTMWTRVGRDLRHGNVLNAVGDLVASSVAHLYRYREQDAVMLARYIFDPNPGRKMAILQSLERRYGSQNVKAAVSHAIQVARRAQTNAMIPSIAGNVVNALAPDRAHSSPNALSRSAR
jgi:hypothetical protein